MTPAAEARIRAAVSELADALVDVLRAETAPAAPDRLLSVDEAAAALGLGRSMTYAAMGSGHLRSLKVGRRQLVPSGAITEFVQASGAVAVCEDSPRRPLRGGTDAAGASLR